MHVISDPSIKFFRRIFFPFFDIVEIIFVISLEFLIFSFVIYFDVKNGWAIWIGSWLGMLAVGYLSIPSVLELDITHNVNSVCSKLSKLGFYSVDDNSFAPRLTSYLRWPRNKLVVSSCDGRVSIRGPKSLMGQLFLQEFSSP